MHRQQWRGLPERDLHMSAVALLPDKSSLAAEKLKDSLRVEGGLEQLVYAAQYHGAQGLAASTSGDADTCADNRYAVAVYGTVSRSAVTVTVTVISIQLRCCIF